MTECPFEVFYTEEDPDGEVDRETPGWFFSLKGQEGSSGSYDSETDAERAAIEDIGLEQSDARQRLATAEKAVETFRKQLAMAEATLAVRQAELAKADALVEELDAWLGEDQAPAPPPGP